MLEEYREYFELSRSCFGGTGLIFLPELSSIPVEEEKGK